MVKQIFSSVVAPEKRFYCKTGIVLDNIDALKDMLSFCNASIELREIFAEHVTSEKNDFADWTKNVFGLDELSNLMKKTKSPQEMSNVIKLYEEQNPSENAGKTILTTSVKNTDHDSNKSTVVNIISKSADEDLKSNSVNSIFENSVSKDIFKKEISDRYDRTEKVFDKVKLMKKHSFYDKKDFEASAEMAKDRYTEIDATIDSLRREGKDVSIPQMLLRNVRPKIAYFVVSQNVDDLKKVNDEFDEIEYEINYAKDVTNKDLKSEIISAVRNDS